MRRPAPRPAGGYLARLCRAKGLHLLVDAFLRLRDLPGTASARLMVAGWLPPSDRQYAEPEFAKLLKAGVGDDFRYWGALERQQKLAFLRSVDVLSVPTTYREPKGIFVLEALASGVPVVQPAHGAFPELLAATGGGVLVPPHDAEQLAQTLHDLLLDRAARLELGRQGRQRVLGDFNADRMAAATLEIYQAYLANRPPDDRPAPSFLPKLVRLPGTPDSPRIMKSQLAHLPKWQSKIFRLRRKMVGTSLLHSRAGADAQRLSASTNERLDATYPCIKYLMCSTPFGINERTTLTNRSRMSCISCAQRLSASTNERLDATYPCIKYLMCSTPFGINERTTLERFSLQSAENVLNAFRHQRTNDSSSRPPVDFRVAVLNAFRHQRTNDGRVVGNRDAGGLCSTPFGINERTTSARAMAASMIRVLNAFRHQRTNDALTVRQQFQSFQCSTPFGINERTTP